MTIAPWMSGCGRSALYISTMKAVGIVPGDGAEGAMSTGTSKSGIRKYSKVLGMCLRRRRRHTEGAVPCVDSVDALIPGHARAKTCHANGGSTLRKQSEDEIATGTVCSNPKRAKPHKGRTKSAPSSENKKFQLSFQDEVQDIDFEVQELKGKISAITKTRFANESKSRTAAFSSPNDCVILSPSIPPADGGGGSPRTLKLSSSSTRMSPDTCSSGKIDGRVAETDCGHCFKLDKMFLERVATGVAVDQGQRAYQEDRHVIEHKIGDWLCFGVYDGHSGFHAAEHAQRRLHVLIEENMKICLDTHSCFPHSFSTRKASHAKPEAIEVGNGSILDDAESVAVEALKRSFALVEEEILDLTDEGGMNDGTTATVVLLTANGQLVVGNVGDSSCVLVRKSGTKRLSLDHKPDLEREKERIEKRGGEVVFSGCWRVGHEKINVRLACSRCLGDIDFKRYLPEGVSEPLVSAEPTIHCHSFNEAEDEFVILASDGIWDALSDEGAAAIVRRVFRNYRPPKKSPVTLLTQVGSDHPANLSQGIGSLDETTAIVPSEPCLEYFKGTKAEMDEVAKEAATVLVNTALARGSTDNITCIVISLLETLET